MDKLYVVMPVYNEALNIEKTIDDWYPITALGNDSRLLLVDDGSKDESFALISELQKKYPKVVSIHKQNEGHGPTVRFAMQKALEADADFVFQTDSDGQTDPQEFLALWEARNEYAVQIGKRWDRKDGWNRKVVSFVLRMLVRVFFGVSCADPNCPFRLFNRETLELYLPLVPKYFSLSNVLLSVYTSYTNVPHRYVPIRFAPRKAGKNSINIKRIIAIAYKNVKLFPQLNKSMRRSLKKG